MEYSTMGAWDIRVTLDLFLGGIGVGAFLFSVMMSFYDLDKHETTVKLGAYSAPIMVCLGLLLLVTKLGVPLKFITTLWNVNFQSVMTVGVFLQLGFVISSIVYAVLMLRKRPIDFTIRITQTIGTFFAFSVGLYHGLFMSSLGRVLWTEITPGLFLASSLVSGIAFVLILERIIAPQDAVSKPTVSESRLPLGLDRFPAVLFIILLVQLASVLLWQFYTGRLELEQALSYDYFMENYRVVWVFTVLIGGTIVPMYLALMSMIRNEERMSTGRTIIVSLLILIGGFMMKHLMIIGGQVSLPIGFLF